ncbi:MAG: hypothetical protein JOY78_21375 [Pseudonocardia sp.]|nr:hypothetical protein [Pseudonocardia sp.]
MASTDDFTELAETAGAAEKAALAALLRAGVDDRADPALDEDAPTHGGNAVSPNGPALAYGLSGEIGYVLARRPRSPVKSLAISLAMGLLYLGFIRVFQWDTKQRLLPYLGLWVISVVMRALWGARSRSGSLTSSDRWSDMILTCRCGCST